MLGSGVSGESFERVSLFCFSIWILGLRRARAALDGLAGWAGLGWARRLGGMGWGGAGGFAHVS